VDVLDDPIGNAASTRADRRVLAIGFVTVALYVLVCLIQRLIYHNGFVSPIGSDDPSALPNRTHLILQMAAYVVVNSALFALYRTVLSMCKRDELARPRSRFLVLAIPCVVNVMLIAWSPRLSQDIFSYMAQGYLGVAPLGNPLTQPAEHARELAIGPALAAFGWSASPGISPYGILWTQVEIAVMKLSGGNVLIALILLKTVIVAASLGSAFCIWSFLGRTRPEVQLFGTLLYLWNPLIIVEFAAEGHNDALMIFFIVAALASSVAQRTVLSLVAQLMAVLTKYIPVLFLPAQLVYLWRSRRSLANLVLNIAVALAITALIALVLYRPIWAGMHSFDGILSRGRPISSASLFGGLNWILRRSPFAAVSGSLTVAALTLPVLLFSAWISLRIKDAGEMASAFTWISIAYVYVASPDYWPWYACAPLALIAVAAPDRLYWLALLISAAARLAAPLDLLGENGFIGTRSAKGGLTGLGATLPLLVLVGWWLLRGRVNRRETSA
jgi:alpha-1,6-mannosyltransferase